MFQKTSEKALIEVRKLVKTFSAGKSIFEKTGSNIIAAVNGVSFSIEKGEILGLVGESGSGKTTIGKMLVKIYEPTEGEILYKGNELKNITRAELASGIQMVFQNPYSSLNPKLSIGTVLGEAITIGHRNKDMDTDKKEIITRTAELLETVGLSPGMYYNYPHQLSGGQRQRVCIARALSVNPELIIADEPVSSLDISIQAQILNLLADLKDNFGFSYLLITHDLNIVRYICDRVIVIHNGIIVEQGSTKDVFSGPRDEYTIKLLSAIPEFPL